MGESRRKYEFGDYKFPNQGRKQHKEEENEIFINSLARRSKKEEELQTSGGVKINRRLTCQERDREDCSLWRLSQEHGLQKLQNVQLSVFIEGLASVGTRQQVLALEDRSAQCVTVTKSHAALRKYV